MEANFTNEQELRFRAAVLEGKAHADRGEFIDEDEMDDRFEQMLCSAEVHIKDRPIKDQTFKETNRQ